MKRILSLGMALMLLLLFPLTALADAEDIVVSLGGDLNESQQNEMLKLFGVDRDEVRILTVTIDEERQYLGGLVSDDKIGKRTISSAYVELLEKGEGIEVDTHNITWVTREMYANALVTAGVENAKVIAAAPFKVSGTGALTGIMKAFEAVTGKELDEEAKEAANEELVTTGELGEVIGKDEAAALIKEIKERIAELKTKDEGEIRKIVIEISANLNINLTDEQIEQIVQLMKKISNLDLNVEKIASQIEKIAGSLDDVKKVVTENKGVIKKILEAIESARQLFNLLFFDDKRYDLARFGRYKFNKKLALASRISGRRSAEDIVNTETGEILVKKGERISYTMSWYLPISLYLAPIYFPTIGMQNGFGDGMCRMAFRQCRIMQ
jgi:uncharacterized protein YpuA (DUF1002 family)